MNTENGNVILWTRQVPEMWAELQKNGIYRVKKEYIIQKNDTIADYYLDLYKWYTKAAKKHLNLADEEEYPIWMCLDEENMLQPIEGSVILKVEIPKDNFLLCNMDAWGYRVNYWYIPTDDEDAKKHAKELEKNGISSDDELISTNKGNFYPVLKRKIIESWDRVFTLLSEDENVMVATAWTIRKEWVKEVREY